MKTPIINRTTLIAMCLAGATHLYGQDVKPPDNSKANKDVQTTAEHQSNNKNDTELTRKIRKSITSDKGMSTYARNVKIITQDGRVTLKGPVRNESEKTAILQKAREVAGTTNVTDEITVAPEK